MLGTTSGYGCLKYLLIKADQVSCLVLADGPCPLDILDVLWLLVLLVVVERVERYVILAVFFGFDDRWVLIFGLEFGD